MWYLVTPLRRVLREKLTASQLLNISLHFMQSSKFITAFTKSRRLFPFWKIRSYRVRGLCECFVHDTFLRRAVVRISPIPYVKDHPLLTVRYCLFNMFTLYGGRSSIPNLRTRHEMLTGTHLSRSFECDGHYNQNIIGQMYTLILQHRMCTAL